jgi:ubiquinone/menaquinone biosynthesis C-methylase UbiE
MRFGSATIPLLQLLPDARVIATELSVPMLQVLKEKLAGESDLLERCTLVQLNAEEVDFVENSIDLLVGAAVLHHLFKPETLLARARQCLKPGGSAIFFEPFENGYGVMNLIFSRVLRENQSTIPALTERQRRYFEYTRDYWTSMHGRDKSSAFFQGADDKWLFTRAYLTEAARAQGLALT